MTQTAKRPASARASGEIHQNIASMASSYPAMWRSLSERGVGRPGDGDGDDGGEKPPSRLQRLEQRHMDERETRQKSEYKRLLKDRLVELRRKDLLEAKKQFHRRRGARHNERVRGIKVQQQQEKMQRQQVRDGVNDGSIDDDSVNDGSVNDGSVNDSCVNDGSIDDDSVNDGSVNDDIVNVDCAMTAITMMVMTMTAMTMTLTKHR